MGHVTPRHSHQQINCFLVGPCRGYIRRACRRTVESESEVVVRVSSGRGVGDGGVPIVGSRCVAAHSEDIADLICAIVRSKLCELAIAL
jgi:hypothetical protein